MDCIVRQATSFSVKHRFPIIAHVKMHANHFYRQILIGIDTSTSKMLRIEKLRKSLIPNRQYPRVPTKPEVSLNCRGHPNRTEV